jgi:hypothetical protein
MPYDDHGNINVGQQGHVRKNATSYATGTVGRAYFPTLQAENNGFIRKIKTFNLKNKKQKTKNKKIKNITRLYFLFILKS